MLLLFFTVSEFMLLLFFVTFVFYIFYLFFIFCNIYEWLASLIVSCVNSLLNKRRKGSTIPCALLGVLAEGQ